MELPKLITQICCESKMGFAQYASVISDTNPLRSIIATKPARFEDFFVFSATEAWEDFLIHPLDYITPQSIF